MPAEALKPIFLITGNNETKIERAIARLKKRFGEGGEERVSARDVTGEEAVMLLNSFTLGATGRLVIVSESEKWKKEDAVSLDAYLADPSPDALLVLLGNPAARSSILALVKEKGEVLDYSLQKTSIPAWIAKELSLRGATATKGAIRALIELRGREPADLIPELEKLACYAGEEALDEEAVRSLVATNPLEVSAFALNDAWGIRNAASALRACEALADAGGNKRDEWVRATSFLTTQVRRALLCLGLREKGIGPDKASALHGLHPYVARKSYEQARRFTRQELEAALLKLGELDYALKGGSPLAPIALVERCVLEII
jgi:DNA polymerase-3 subunit delta